MFDHLWLLIQRGGVVMWPLLFLSLLSMTLAFERAFFWLRINHRRRLANVEQMARLLRGGQTVAARALAQADDSLYGHVVATLLDESINDALVVDLIESSRSRLERFMPTLSTIITVAPMLGILGTVFGIISSFQVLSDRLAVSDPRDVGHGIAEALLTTAVGLIVAIFVLFPYNGFRAQVDRTLGRIESLVAAASGPVLQADQAVKPPGDGSER